MTIDNWLLLLRLSFVQHPFVVSSQTLAGLVSRDRRAEKNSTRLPLVVTILQSYKKQFRTGKRNISRP